MQAVRSPDFEGPAGRAYNLIDAGLARRPEQQAGLGAFLVNVPGAHPFWSWWLVSVVHLRPLPGAPDAQKRYPEAQYEFMIVTLNPEQTIDPHNLPPDGFRLLTPPDVAVQFHGVSDSDAARLCGQAALAIVNGLVSPDQDYRSVWERLITGTIEHYKAGTHPSS
jgi:hypothetical protein